MQFMDTHIHLQDFKQRCATDIIAAGLKSGVNKFICVSAAEPDWAKAAALHEMFPETVIPAFGLHPWYADKAGEGWSLRLAGYLERYPSALVGETGLDRLHGADENCQKKVFDEQIYLSKEYGRSLLIHAVKAQPWLEGYWKRLPQKFVFHSYAGKAEMVKQILAYGGCVSFSASALKSSGLEKAVNALPVERLLLETDAPYQPLCAGEENSPENIPLLAARLAALYNMPEEDFAARIYNNSLEFVKTWKTTSVF